MMAAILATLAVLVARAVIDPPVVPDIAGRESFLFQHLALAAAAALVYQVAFLARGDLPDYRSGLNWGAGGFAATVVAPLLALLPLPAGVLPPPDGRSAARWVGKGCVSHVNYWWCPLHSKKH